MRLVEIKKMLSLAIGTFAGIGLIPVMPGTITTLSIAIIWHFFIPEEIFYNASEKSIYYSNYIIFYIIILLFSYLAVYICKSCEEEFGRDGKQIVIDEVVGYLLAVMFLPKTLMVAIYAFILFRVFDIAKPLFINKAQRLKHGWGVMMDDLLAGVTTNVLLITLYHIKPQFFMLY